MQIASAYTQDGESDLRQYFFLHPVHCIDIDDVRTFGVLGCTIYNCKKTSKPFVVPELCRICWGWNIQSDHSAFCSTGYTYFLELYHYCVSLLFVLRYSDEEC